MTTSHTKPFGELLRDLLIERGFTNGMRNANFTRFAATLPTVHYESIRKFVAGHREPSVAALEEIASALGVSPNVFVEYRLAQARNAFDPSVVGARRAVKNLSDWEAGGNRDGT